MPQPIGVYDGGSTVIKIDGKSINLGVVIYRESINESHPVEHRAYCIPEDKEAIIRIANKEIADGQSAVVKTT